MPLVALVIVVIATCMVGRYPRLQTAGIIVGTLLLGMTLGSRQRQQLDVEWSEERQQVELIVTSEVKVKKKTVVFVTHDIDEAIFLSDRIVMMASKPGHVYKEISVPFVRPRVREDLFKSPAYTHLRNELVSLFYKDVAERIGNEEVVL